MSINQCASMHIYITIIIAPSGYPVSVVAVASDSSSFNLHWSPPAQEERNGKIIYYGIKITEADSGETIQIINTTDSNPSYTVSDLHPYYQYLYSVRTFTAVGNGPYSPTTSFQMPQDGQLSVKIRKA